MRRAIVLLLLLGVHCAPSSAPRVAPHIRSPLPLEATSIARRVVLISFDGLGADALARQTGLPAFEQLARDGAAARVIPVNPTLTSSTHAAMLTGVGPQQNGIVSNHFHVAGTPPEQSAVGMRSEIDAETIVEAARRQGKRVGAMFPTVDARSPRRTADFGLVWTEPVTRGRIVELTRRDFHREWVPPTWTRPPHRRTSFSPIMRARLEWSVPGQTPLRTAIDVVAYDTTDDRAENYDAYFIESDEREIAHDARGWFAVARQSAGGVYGSWSKFLAAEPTLDVALYWGSIARTNAYPDSYRAMLDAEVGFWPGGADDGAGVDATTYLEQMERLAAFYTRAQTLTIERMPFDLLLAYQPALDQSQHACLGRPVADRVLRATFLAVDRAVAAIRARLDPAQDALIVTGDHGLVVARRRVAINRLLADHGLAPRWRAYPSSSVAHLYRFSGPDDGDAVAEMLRATGYFERIDRKDASAHPNSGDLIAWAWPDITMTERTDAPLVSTIEPHGHHGALNSHPELQPAFFAIGAGIPAQVPGEIAQTAIARLLAGLLGIAPPGSAAQAAAPHKRRISAAVFRARRALAGSASGLRGSPLR